MKIDQQKFYGACVQHGIKNLAKAIGISRNALSRKLKDPTHRLYLSEYFAICFVLDVNPNIFMKEG